jgi:PAS domain S-box-containing protein
MTITTNFKFNLSGYRYTEQLYQDDKTVVVRAVQIDGEFAAEPRSVVIKLLSSAYPTYQAMLKFRHQYTITKNLDLPGIVRTYGLEEHGQSYALIMEDFGGISLTQYCRNHCLSLPEILKITIQVANTLHALGQRRIVHKDIKPANILIHPVTQQVKLIDFSIASLLPRANQEMLSPSLLEGTLAYLSPEQTGRMNRGIDYRSDFYALGVTLYELLTGKLPFETDDPLELVYCHLAHSAVSVQLVNPDIPLVVAQIVAKLMAKNAEDRYQSALGLRYDLEQCLSRWLTTGAITEFEVGERDVVDRFIIPEKLYGRSAEVKILLDAFDRVASLQETRVASLTMVMGHTELVLVAGFSGIGKTAVINEVHKPITRQQGYFIKGKFDQFNRNIPLSGFVQAFQDLIGQILGESDAQLALWKSRILAAVGENGQVLIEVIPDLEKIIGVQPLVTELSGILGQNRFSWLAQKFIQVFATPARPLTIFLDDLQWADAASFHSIELLMGSKGCLLLLGAYRDNEVSASHPLLVTVAKLRQAQKIVQTITLAALDLLDINRLVADTLHCPIDRAMPLTEVIVLKTAGNPFFTTQYLKALYEDGEIVFNPAGYWECNIGRLQSLSLTTDVLELMVRQLHKLSSATQQVLKLAACIGNQFDLETLAIVLEQSPARIATALWPVLEAGLILPTCQMHQFLSDEMTPQLVDKSNAHVIYRFLHDRVQQAAYSIIPAAERALVHYRIGQLLLQKIPATAIEEQIFVLVNHLNYGIAQMHDQAARDRLAALNLAAAQRAKRSNADQVAQVYVEIALDLLGSEAWQRQYDLSLTLYQLGAEVAFLGSKFDRMDHYIATAIQQTQTEIDQVGVYLIKIQALTFQQQFVAAISMGKSILQKLGVCWQDDPTAQDVQQAIQEVNFLIDRPDFTIADIFDLPTMVDTQKIAIIQIAVSISPACHIVDSPIFSLLNALQVKLSIQHGHIPDSAISYAIYGCALIDCNQLETAIEFSRLAYRFVLEADTKNQIPEIVVPVGLFLHHRHAHLQETLSMFQLGYQTGLETGKLEHVGYCGYALCLHTFWCGQSLAEVADLAQLYHQQLLDLDRLNNANYCEIVWFTAATLLKQDAASLLQSEQRVEQAMLAGNNLHQRIFYLHRALSRFLLGKLAEATTDIKQVANSIQGTAGTICKVGFYFYDSLIALAHVPASVVLELASQSEDWLLQVQENQNELAIWAAAAPMNYLHKWQLVEAEKSRVLGQRALAADRYEEAITGAKTNGYLPEEALANELAAKFYLGWHKEKIAAIYMQAAYYCYAQWGATAKTDDLEQCYSQLIAPILQSQQPSFNVLSTLATFTHPLANNSDSHQEAYAFDLVSVIQSAQALSSTIDLEELIYQLSQIILKNSGAETCLLALPDSNDQWQIRSIATVYSSCLINPELSQPLSNHHDYPVNLIYWIKNHQQSSIFDARKSLAINDQYLLKYQPPSVFGLPILKQGKIMGVLYLEHRQAADVFTENRTTVISFLCTQAAIALENAHLYQESQAAATEVRLKQRYLAALLDNIPHLTWLKDEQCQFIAVNQSFSDVLGYEISTLVGKNDFDLHPTTLAQKYRDDDLRVMASGERQVVEEMSTNAQGEERWAETIKTPMRNSEGAIVGTVGISLDITDRKQAQIDLHLTNQSLAATNLELQRATRLKDEFLATMSHELRTPLNAILGMSEVLQEEVFGTLNVRQQKSLHTIQRSGEHLLSLINDILDVSKISAGKVELDMATITVEHLCESSLVFVKQQAFNKQIQLDLQLSVGSGQIIVDERRMRQVLINLLSNAVKFTPPDGQVVLRVIRYNSVNSLDDQNWIELAVTDTGIGITNDDQQKLFQPFVQLDSSLNRQQEGTGLGLTLVKKIVELHGGTISLQSEIGQGSCFAVRLPHSCLMMENSTVVAPDDNLNSSLSESAMEITPQAVILLAEDNESNIHTFSSYLIAKGYHLLLATNGYEAISLLKCCTNELTPKDLPDLILMDIQMPGMDGIEAISWIRQNSQLAKIPIIALTALAMDGDQERCLAAGATDYLTKPVKLKQLNLRIRELLDRN